MKKKLIGTLMCMSLAASVFTGCSSAPATPATPDAPAPSTTQKEEPAPAETPEGGKKIVYWSMWESTEAQGQSIQAAIDQYQKDTGNIVDVQFKGRTGIREGLQAALDAGTTIDLFDEDIDRVNTTWGKYLLDLESYATASNYEDTAVSGLISACREVGGGTLKSIPYQPNIFAFFYNKDLFDQAGITDVPKTWDEFLATCESLKAAGITPITCDDAYITAMAGYHLARTVGEERVIQIVNEGLWAEEPAVLETAKAYADLASKGYFSEYIASNVWPAGQNTELALGEAAMYLNGSWLPNEVLGATGPDFRWGCFSYPAVPNGKTGVEAANFGAQVFAVNKGSKVPQEAFDLITYITKGQFDAELSKNSTGIPADTSNTEWPTLLSDVKPVLDSLTTRYTWAAGIEANSNMTPIIKENFLKLCGGQLTAEQFVDAMEKASN
ncbi:MAG: ABC transporter substrate-binding protein [Niameybacter sp.]|uniref:ABC transporter substrate-binding protein n=1 Tax=Niameybacter sp. TaxID=2033640 RepID=UPI002FC7E869